MRKAKDYSLDGPLWLDPESVYIDDDGQLRAKMPCFPDPNITKALLGPDAKKVPDDPGEFLQRITQGKDVAFEVMPENRVGGAASVGGTASMNSTSSTVADTDEPNPIDAFTDLAGLNFSFEGELKAGPMKLGKGALLNLREGTKVTATGTLADMNVSMEAPVKSLQLSQGETRIQSGNGNLKMDVHFTKNGVRKWASICRCMHLNWRTSKCRRQRQKGPSTKLALANSILKTKPAIHSSPCAMSRAVKAIWKWPLTALGLKI